MAHNTSSKWSLLALVVIIALAIVWMVNRAGQPSTVVFDGPSSATSVRSEAASIRAVSSAPSQTASAVAQPASVAPAPTSTAPVPASASTGELPPSVLIRMPFASQAPLGNWDPPYDEACEEASLILAHAYFNGEKSLSKEEMDRRILELVDWETQRGLPIDITTAQMETVAEERFGLTTRLVENPTIDDIKRALAAGHPVVVPLAGRDIGNPYFTGEGPWYHVLVILGYGSTGSPQADYFVTHDVGTRRGKNYRYRQAVLHDAIHDWTGVKEEIRQGKKVMLVVEG